MFGHDDHNQKDQTNDNVVTPSNDAPVPVPDDVTVNDHTAVNDDLPVVMDSPPADNGSDSPATDSPAPAPVVGSDDGNLMDIKRQALQQLQPLVGHLDQSPEEKFKTTMMMIQAADDKTLVQTAYDAAQQISDEKTRAQALLDVINEINYFTHPQGE